MFQVDRLEVINKEWVRVRLAPQTSTGVHVCLLYFQIQIENLVNEQLIVNKIQGFSVYL